MSRPVTSIWHWGYEWVELHLHSLCPFIALRRNKFTIKVHPCAALRFSKGCTAHRRGWGVSVRPGCSLPPGKTRYPLYRRLGGPQGRSGQVQKILPPPGFDPQTVQPVAGRYTDWVTLPTNLPLLVCYYSLDLSYLFINNVRVSTCIEFLKKVTEFVIFNIWHCFRGILLKCSKWMEDSRFSQ